MYSNFLDDCHIDIDSLLQLPTHACLSLWINMKSGINLNCGVLQVSISVSLLRYNSHENNCTKMKFVP